MKKENQITNSEFVDVLREFLGYSSLEKSVDERGLKEKNEAFYLETPEEIEPGVRKAS